MFYLNLKVQTDTNYIYLLLISTGKHSTGCVRPTVCLQCSVRLGFFFFFQLSWGRRRMNRVTSEQRESEAARRAKGREGCGLEKLWRIVKLL